MKSLILLCCIVGSASLLADPPDTTITQDTVQSNDAINSPTSVMQNTQVNSGVTHDAYGGGVSCARSTLQAGAIQSFNGVYDEPQIFIGFNIPLGDSDCDIAAKNQISLVHQQTKALEERVRRDNESHAQEIKKRDLQYADLLAKVCLNFHGKLVAEKDSLMAKECQKYSPTVVKHGHTEADHFDEDRFTRVSGHSHD